MINAHPDFKLVFEEYILQMAGHFIDSADESEQASLIQLLSSIDPCASSEHPGNLAGGVIDQLEEQWHQALNEPSGNATRHRSR
jgi:hypothetical protein